MVQKEKKNKKTEERHAITPPKSDTQTHSSQVSAADAGDRAVPLKMWNT